MKTSVRLEADAAQQLLQELAGGAHKRPPLLVFVVARRFSDEHELRVNGAFAGDGASPLRAQRAGMTGADARVELAKRGLLFLDGYHEAILCYLSGRVNLIC